MSDSNNDSIFEYDNGVMLHLHDLTDVQLTRYGKSQKKIHEPVEEYWFEQIFNTHPGPDFCFLDVGAAVGYYSILVKRRFPEATIWAVEPIPDFRERMRANFRINGLDPDTIRFIPWAVYPGARSINLALRHFGSFVIRNDQQLEGDSITVEARNLEETLEGVTQPIDIAKFDIQSAELAVFNDAKPLLQEGKVRHWIIGTHGPRIHETLLDLFSKSHTILFEDKAPQDQPDGLIVARFKDA